MKKRNIEAEFIQAHNDYIEALFRYCHFRVSDRELAKDLVQETFTKTWNYIRGGGEVKSMKSFLYRTLSNLIVDEYRKKKADSLDEMAEDGFDPGFDDTERLVNKLDGEKVVALLGLLADKYREAIFMKYVEEMSLEEISEYTGESRNTITVRIHRGLGKLKELYEQHD
jgi:RNA polymerase sigma-70 factor (ECF subfamily)